MEANRAAGSFSIIRQTTDDSASGTAGSRTCGGSTGSLTCLISSSTALRALNGGLPVSRW